ncbi:hypothetical protein PHAGINATOR_149 [Shigella phage vB_SboM_Phaginator]|nr:hypothetical protein PHAGINATOR_149 [Shigella phage vB_SboM_Phaginator]
MIELCYSSSIKANVKLENKMKRCELIRNVAIAISASAFSFSMFVGFICGLLTTAENVFSLVVAFLIGLIAIVMDKISKGE